MFVSLISLSMSFLFFSLVLCVESAVAPGGGSVAGTESSGVGIAVGESLSPWLAWNRAICVNAIYGLSHRLTNDVHETLEYH